MSETGIERPYDLYEQSFLLMQEIGELRGGVASLLKPNLKVDWNDGAGTVSVVVSRVQDPEDRVAAHTASASPETGGMIGAFVRSLEQVRDQLVEGTFKIPRIEKQAIKKVVAEAVKAQAGDVRVVPVVTVGRIVHYMNLGDKDGKYPSETQAALVTGVNADGTPSLVVFYRTGMFTLASVPYAETPTRGHWSWPPR